MDSWGSWVLMTIAILLLLIWLAIWFCDRTWPKTETTEYRVAMSNSLMIVSFCVYKFIKYIKYFLQFTKSLLIL